MRNIIAFIYCVCTGLVIHSPCLSVNLVDDLEDVRSIVNGRLRYNKSLLLEERNTGNDLSTEVRDIGLRENIATLLQSDIGQTSVKVDYRFYELLKTITDCALETTPEKRQRQVNNLFFYTYLKRQQDQNNGCLNHLPDGIDEVRPCGEILNHIEPHVTPCLVTQIDNYLVMNGQQMGLYAYPQRSASKAREKTQEIIDRATTAQKRVLDHAKLIEKLIQKNDKNANKMLDAFKAARSKMIALTNDAGSISTEQSILQDTVTAGWTVNSGQQALSLDTYEKLSQEMLPRMLAYEQHMKKHSRIARETLDTINEAEKLLDQILPNSYLPHTQQLVGESKDKTKRKARGKKKGGKSKTRKAGGGTPPISDLVSKKNITEEETNVEEEVVQGTPSGMTDKEKLDALFGEATAEGEEVAEEAPQEASQMLYLARKPVDEAVMTEQIALSADSETESVIEDWMVDLSRKRQVVLDDLLKDMERTFHHNGFSVEKRPKKVVVKFVSPINHHKIHVYYDAPHGSQLKKTWPAWRFNFREALRDAGYAI